MKHCLLHRNTLASYLKQSGYTKSKAKFNHDFFQNIDSETKAYWLGFMMADGCVSMTHSPKIVIRLCKKDGHHLQLWHDTIDSCVPLCWSTKSVQSQHYSLKMCEDLIDLGCTPKKSLTLSFPEIEKSLLHHFVRGYFDGDGCASLHNKKQKTPQCRITFVGTESFLKKLSEIVCIDNKLHFAGKARSLQINGNKKICKIVSWMYQDAKIYLKRKREVFNAVLPI